MKKNDAVPADMEIELKLSMTSDEIDRFSQWRELSNITIGQAKNIRLEATYYDTKALCLKSLKSALRIRREVDKWVQTFKTSQKSQVSENSPLEERLEINSTLLQKELDLSILCQHEKIPAEVKACLQAEMQDVFTTQVCRIIREIEYQGSVIEIAEDRGVIIAGGHQDLISEVELELKSGDAQALLQLVDQWQNIFKFEVGGPSKAARGYALFHEYSL